MKKSDDLDVYNKKFKKLQAKQKYLDKCNKLTFGTYTKRLVAIIIGVSLINVELSYILAFLGKDPLVDVTNQLIVTILGTAAIYIIRAFFDTWSENKYGDANKLINELDQKINEMQEATEENESFKPESIYNNDILIVPCSDSTTSDSDCAISESDDDQYGN